MSNSRITRFLRKHYTKRLRRALKKRKFKQTDQVCREYQMLFQKYMDQADLGINNEKFSSYLNIYSGLAAYELLRGRGFSSEESMKIYDEMCVWLRRIAALSYRIVDLTPNGYKVTVDSLKKDMVDEKAVCWETEITEDSADRFEYKITRCLYYDTCKSHGYPEFTKVFCYHDRHAYDVLHRHARFVRYEAIGEGGACCHDAFVNCSPQNSKGK